MSRRETVGSYYIPMRRRDREVTDTAAIRAILPDIDAYLAGDPAAAQRMLEAANLSGQAIRVTATTAPHAMSYKLTGLYGIPHGHAVAICLPRVWRYMAARGDEALQAELNALTALTGGVDAFEALLKKLEIAPPAVRAEDIETLAASVNVQRLSNNPLPLDAAALRALYAELASGQ